MRIDDIADGALIECYLKNRDEVLKDLKNRYEALKTPIEAEQAMIEEEIAKRLVARKAKNTSTEFGCAFFQGWTSVKTVDKAEWVRHVIGGELWDLADIRPLKSGIEEAGLTEVPGLKIESGQSVHIRKG